MRTHTNRELKVLSHQTEISRDYRVAQSREVSGLCTSVTVWPTCVLWSPASIVFELAIVLP